MSNGPYTPTNGQCKNTDTLTNNLCYVSGTYSPFCNSGDAYIPNNNVCISSISGYSMGSNSITTQTALNSTCSPGFTLDNQICYPNGTYAGLCKTGDTYSSVTNGSNMLVWCNVASNTQIPVASDKDIYNSALNHFINATISCEVSFNVLLALSIPLIIMLFLIAFNISYRYGLISSFRVTNRP